MSYLIGVDSDGTVFDTMNIKHKEVFWQCMLEKWNVLDCDNSILKVAENINLYSSKRGINRFSGLLMVMESTHKFDFLDKTPLSNFINSGYSPSNEGLEKYIAENEDSMLLFDVLSWSRMTDVRFAEKTLDIKPFTGADIAIKAMAKNENVDMVVVSSASQEILKRDLSRCGLDCSFKKIMGQESGKKVNQLIQAENLFAPDKVLMIGDAPSDFEAAKKAGAYFYPIIPKKEEECWENFVGQYFDCFINNDYENCEKLLCEQFFNSFDN